MPLTASLGAGELAATRFAVSPLGETVSGLQLLGLGLRPHHARPWLRWARAEAARCGLELPTAWPLLVTGRPKWPEFLVPSPSAPEPGIDEQLERMQATRASAVRTSLRRVFGADLPPVAVQLAARPAPMLRRVAAELRAAHDLLVAPHWPRLRAVLTADIGYRARQVAVGGLDRLFADLHQDVTWHDGVLRLHRRGVADRPVSLGERGLVLVPSVLIQGVSVKMHTVTQTTLRYPARGAATIWTAGLLEPPGLLVELLGRPRARLLERLRAPGSPTELARDLGVTPSAVTQHLRILRAAGLVSAERAGRRVLYVTSPLGRSLIEA